MSLHITRHAAERYIDRVEPHLTPDEARAKIERLLAECGEWTPTRPAWASGPTSPSDRFAVIADSIAFPVANGCVLTCFTRGGFGEVVRARRRQRRLARKQARKAREQVQRNPVKRHVARERSEREDVPA